MALEIAIDELGIGSDKVAYITLPANRNDVIDAMDREKIFGETFLRITECDEIPELAGYEFSEEPTLDELNFLAKRIEEIASDKEDFTSLIAYRALLKRGFGTINEAINSTYNLQTIPVYPCKNVYAYGEIVLENEMLEGLENIPDELYDLLDPDKVGRAMMEREGGVFIGGYYAVPSSYEPALVYDQELPEPMDNWIFKIEVAGIPEPEKDFGRIKTEIFTLPTDEDYMQDVAEALGKNNIEDCMIMNFESAIPQIQNECFENIEDIYILNDIAQKFSELSREDAAKFKAVVTAEKPSDLGDIENILFALNQYEADISINYASEFGAKYLAKHMPPDFDRSLLKGPCTAEFAEKIISANECAFTEYGVVSKHGGHLYSMVEASEQEVNPENNLSDTDENPGMKLGL